MQNKDYASIYFAEYLRRAACGGAWFLIPLSELPPQVATNKKVITVYFLTVLPVNNALNELIILFLLLTQLFFYRMVVL